MVNARLNSQGADDGRLFAFSCGHRFTSAELHGSVLPRLGERLPNTARAMRQLFEGGATDQLACPQCVDKHVQCIAKETPIWDVRSGAPYDDERLTWTSRWGNTRVSQRGFGRRKTRWLILIICAINLFEFISNLWWVILNGELSRPMARDLIEILSRLIGLNYLCHCFVWIASDKYDLFRRVPIDWETDVVKRVSVEILNNLGRRF